MTFEFATAGRIVFGRGSIQRLPSYARELGRRAFLLLGGADRGREALAAALRDAGVESVAWNVAGEPTTHQVDEAAAAARAEDCEFVIALGGGSVLDAGKAVAAMLANPGRAIDYLEVVGGGQELARPAAPCITAPTTAGTGAEVTRNAVLGVPEHQVKASLRSHQMLPRLALIDPELTLSLPPAITAYTGMDALTQLIEPLVSNAANPLTDGICREGLARAARALPAAFRDGSDLAAREDMAAAALCGGLALANARLGAVHGFAGVLGGLTAHPHGAICARLLPFVMEANIRALSAQQGDAVLARYAEVARILTGQAAAAPRDGVQWVHELAAALKIPPLRDSGLAPAAFDPVITAAQRASSMRGNPVKLTTDELRRILEAAL